MAEAEAEAAFLSSMRAMNENAGSYEVTGGGSEQQIDSSSSDEYDPAQEVLDIPLSSGSYMSNPVSSVDVRKNDVPFPVFTHSEFVPAINGVKPAPTTDNLPLPQSQSSSKAPGTSTASEALLGTPQSMNDPSSLEQTGEAPGQPSVLQTSLTDHNSEDVSAHTNNPGQTVSNDVPNAAANVALNVDITRVTAGTPTHNRNLTNPSEIHSSVQTSQARSPVVDSPSSAVPKARLPHDKVGLLEDRIKEDERGDMEAWLSLIGEHRRRGRLDEARKTYERFFAVFPSAAEQWVAHINMENDAQNRTAVETIFNHTLMQIPNVQLWSAYIDHVRRHHNVTTDTSGSARGTVSLAYNLALSNIGIDKESGKLWQDCIQFIKSGAGNVVGNSWQDKQKMDSLRKTYKAAICVPTQSVESLWREYNSFEMSIDKITGRKFLQEQSPSYMSARSSYTELQNITRDLKRTTLPILPPALGFDGDVEYMKQVDIWKRWIQWEKDDPLVLKLEDPVAYKARITFVYKQALMALRFWPDMWFDAAEFCFLNDLEAEGNEFLNQGISANPESCLLAFKRADRLELSTSIEDGDEGIRRKGLAVREPYDKVLDALYDLIAKTTARETKELARIESQFADTQSGRLNGRKTEDDDRESEDDANEAEQKKTAQMDIVKNLNALQIRLIQKTLSHVWIALMRATRRIQGKGKVGTSIGGSRQILTDARKRGRLTSDIWVAAALLEFHMGEGEATKRIFERGAKLYPEDESFALEYIKHLIANNDHTNARVVFETTVGRLSQKSETLPKAKPLYAYFHGFESRHGELSQIIKLEKRISDLFPEDPKLAAFSQRFTHEGFDPTVIRPIISTSAQARPKVLSSIETSTPTHNSPPIQYTQPANSPKRPLPFEESDNEATRPRKVARGESPLKGAAGRRLDQQKRSRLPNEIAHYEGQTNTHPLPPPPLPRDVLFLLSIIPKASTYHATKFKPEEMVRLIRETHIPNSVSQLRPPPLLSSNGMSLPQMPAMTHNQYNGQYPFHR